MTRYYHASPCRFRHGDILSGGHSGGAGTAHHNVCMTDSPIPHATIIHHAMSGNWHLYEVEPIGRVSFVAPNGEYQAKAARVLTHVGSTCGIMAHKPHHRGSFVYPKIPKTAR